MSYLLPWVDGKYYIAVPTPISCPWREMGYPSIAKNKVLPWVSSMVQFFSDKAGSPGLFHSNSQSWPTPCRPTERSVSEHSGSHRWGMQVCYPTCRHNCHGRITSGPYCCAPNTSNVHLVSNQILYRGNQNYMGIHVP